MSRPITQPINQVRLTNVAVVRMNKSGKRFEIACYRNKVVNYRQGLETDLSEVLQTERVFTNVSKGQFAKASELESAFGTRNEVDVCRIILEKGLVQVGDLERAEQLESVQREISTWIANHCVHAKTQRPYTMTQIRQAMQESNFVVHNPATRPLKRQYLDCIKCLQQAGVLPDLERAKMELVLQVPRQYVTQLQQQARHVWKLTLPEETTTTVTTTTTATTTGVTTTKQQQDSSDDDDNDDDEFDENGNKSSSSLCTFTLLVDPSLYRQLDEWCKSLDGCQLQIIQQVVMNQDSVNLESEVEQRQAQAAAALAVTAAAATAPLPTTDQSLQTLTTSQLDLKDDVDDEGNKHQQDDDNDNEYDDEVEVEFVPQTKKSQRQNNKKSKKAKRREKEEAQERQARIEVERQRRQDRELQYHHHDPMDGIPGGKSGRDQQDAVVVTLSNAAITTTTSATKSSSSSSSSSSCNTCGGSFVTAADYRAHFRSDWHRFNQKLKLQGKPPISHEEFVLCDADMLLFSHD